MTLSFLLIPVLTHPNARLFFAALLLAMLGYDGVVGLPWTSYLLLAVAWLGLVGYGSAVIGSQFFIPVRCSAPTTEKQIALSFDDGPIQEFTPELLQILAEHRVPAAFFCIGHRVAGHENLLRQLYEAGHLLGNHSFSHHRWFDLFSASRMLADLQRANEAIHAATGLRPRLFRPPYGVTNPNLARAIRRGGFVPIGWNLRSLDTVIHDEKKLLRRVLRGLRPGAVVLFHDTSPATRAILPQFIREATARGYTFVRLDQLLRVEAYA